MKPANNKTTRLAPLCAALVLALSDFAVAASGKFQFVSGDVRVQTKTGEIIAVAKGTEVNEGDVIFSGSPALAQLKMDDGGTLVVRPNTRLTITTYRFNGAEDGAERATYRLDRGSVRAITGQIGKRNKQNYLIQTPTASIGVRGTDHEPAFIPKNEDGYPGAKPGTYDKVNAGETYIETKGGLVVVKPNSVGYAENELSVPTILPFMPSFYNKMAKKGSASSRAVAMPRPGVVGARRLASASGTEAVIQLPILIKSGSNLSAVDVVAPDLGSPDVGPPDVGSPDVGSPDVGVPDVGVPDVGVPGSAGGVATLAAYTDAKKSTALTQIEQVRNLKFDPSGAALAESGSSSELGVNWGRWDNGFEIEGKDPRGSLHFLNTSNLTTRSQIAAMLPITATYNLVGGTRPTDELGRVGDLTAISANVNFATQKITDYTLSANNSGRTWDARGNGTFGQFLSSSEGLRLNGLCTGCRTDDDDPGRSVTSTANGFAKGAFVGSQAQGLITTYGIRANEKGISGAAVLKRP
ncbi:MAG: FecR family protein [Burkholderiales bacterium]